jgi:ribosomal RNA-processing protein 1
MGKIRVKSHVQQERNMSGTAKKFPGPAPEINKPKRATPYVPKLPKDGGGGAGASSSSNGANPFARQLASGDKEVRDATFAALAKWLNARKDVPMLDMKKIWKGLFYAMWHADGWDVQEELAERMGEAVHEMKHKVALCYLGVFYITARREWIGIDRHRMDKYLRLVRRMTSHALRYCANRDWAEGATSDVSQMFTRAAMAPASAPNAPSERGVVDVGLRLHLAEVFVPELRKVAAGQDYVEVGCDPEKENEGNGGAPITVFRGGKKPTEKKGVPGAFGREKRPDTKSKDKKTKDAKKDLGPKKRDPKPVPPSSVALLLAPFSAVLAVDAHRALHERVVSEIF